MKQNQRDYFQNNQNLTENLFSKLGCSGHSSMYSKGEKLYKYVFWNTAQRKVIDFDAWQWQHEIYKIRWKFATANL